MKLGTEAYSPAVLAKIEYAGGNAHSFAKASEAMARLAELSISPKHQQRLTERLGKQRAEQRDQQVQAMQGGKLKPACKQPPLVVAIHVDAGKVQLREADGGGAGVRQPHWGDTKVACCQSYGLPPEGGGKDPQPDPPPAFVDPPRVLKLVRQMERVRGAGPEGPPTGSPLFKLKLKPPPRKKRGLLKRLKRPPRLVRTVVATTSGCEAFGWMVAAEAMARNFYAADRKALVGDGGNWIGPLQQMHFPGWALVLDFLHLLVHLWAAAMAAYPRQAQEGWALYQRMLRDAWAGRARAVLEALERESERLGSPPPKAGQEDPRRIVAGTRDYVRANLDRMDYARWRREGLPITSALVESLIKQINFRVKGSEKFWIKGGVESVLSVRAAYLSEDGRDESFHRHRPRGPAVGRNRLRTAA